MLQVSVARTETARSGSRQSALLTVWLSTDTDPDQNTLSAFPFGVLVRIPSWISHCSLHSAFVEKETLSVAPFCKSFTSVFIKIITAEIIEGLI